MCIRDSLIPALVARKSTPCACVNVVPDATLTLALIYLPDLRTGFLPLAFCVTDDDSVSSSATLSLVLTVNVESASTIGLTPVMLALCPGKGSNSDVSTSH